MNRIGYVFSNAQVFDESLFKLCVMYPQFISVLLKRGKKPFLIKTELQSFAKGYGEYCNSEYINLRALSVTSVMYRVRHFK